MLAEIIKVLLLLLLIVCAVSVNFTKSLLQSVIIFMAYSVIMSVIWAFLRAPDLAVTEAAVGAGISSVMMFITLKKLRDINQGFKEAPEEGGSHEETP